MWLNLCGEMCVIKCLSVMCVWCDVCVMCIWCVGCSVCSMMYVVCSVMCVV